MKRLFVRTFTNEYRKTEMVKVLEKDYGEMESWLKLCRVRREWFELKFSYGGK
jgi:hypothetical protein